jgi:HEAT repeat protein/lysophospholipase L1-like esterase
MNPSGRARQSLLVNLLLALAVGVIFAGGLEGLARLLEAKQPQRQADAPQVDWHGNLYTFVSPGRGWPLDGEFNRDGLRDVSHAIEKPPRTYRVAFLGDSVTMGVALAPEQAFPRVLGQMLEQSGRKVEVLNVALSGWSTSDERAAYERLARRYQLDHVVLSVCLNDIDELNNTFARPPVWLSALHRRSALVRRIVNARGREIENTALLFTQPDSRRVRAAFRHFFDEVRTLRDEVRASGATFSVLVLPYRFQFTRDAPPANVQQRIAAFCREQGIPCLDALPLLRDGGASYFQDSNHLNARGSRRMAEALLVDPWLPAGPSHAEVLSRFRGGCVDAPACLADALADSHPAVREAAAWTLERARSASQPTLLLLAKNLRSDIDVAVRAACARTLTLLGAAARFKPALAEALAAPNESVRWAAIRGLQQAHLSASEDLPLLVAALANDDPFVRSFATETLAAWGPAARAAAPALAEAAHRNDEAGLLAMRALPRIGAGASTALPALLATLRDGDARRREKAAVGIGHLRADARPAVPQLSACLSDPDAGVRLECAHALEATGAAAAPAIGALAHCLDDASEPLRVACANALRAIGPAARPAASSLAARLDDPNADVRATAASALAAMGATADTTLPALYQRLRSERVVVRRDAAVLLGQLGPAAASGVTPLEACLDDTSAIVRAECARALGRIGPRAEPALQQLIARLADPDEDVRVQAARALGRIADHRAAPALKRSGASRDARLAREAQKALARIGRHTALSP